MALCEMCGKESRLVTAEIEGGELKVCSNCAEYGTVKKREFTSRPRYSGNSSKRNEMPQFRIVGNFSSLIRSAREKKGMSQEDFAKSLNERESIVAKWEQGVLRPRLGTARRLEKILGVKLVEKEEMNSAKVEMKKGKSDEFTLGDFIKVRKRTK